MKLPWVLKYSIKQLLGTLKGSALIAWLEGPAGAAINAIYGSKVQQVLDAAEAALIAEVGKVEVDLNRERERLVAVTSAAHGQPAAHPSFFESK